MDGIGTKIPAPGYQADRAETGLRRPVGLLGTGLYVPDRVVANAEVAAGLDTSDAWITSRIGIRERRFVDDELASSDMAVVAARQALTRAGVEPADVDAVIVATFTPDQPLPSTALMVIDAIGATRAVPFDLSQAACAGGVYALVVAAHLLQSEVFRTVLVVGVDCGSRITDPLDRGCRVFFGDAAGAVVVSGTEPGYGLLSWDLGAELSYAVEIPAGGSRTPASAETVEARSHFLRQDGRTVWRTATSRLPGSIQATARRAGVPVDDIRYFLLHQANNNIIDEAMRALEVPADRAPRTVSWLGNTGAASMFTVLHETMETALKHDDVIVMAGIGAGFMWGSLCFRHFGGKLAC